MKYKIFKRNGHWRVTFQDEFVYSNENFNQCILWINRQHSWIEALLES